MGSSDHLEVSHLSAHCEEKVESLATLAADLLAWQYSQHVYTDA